MSESEGEQEKIPISVRTIETVLYELQLLIEETEGQIPDPLTDDHFQARNELLEALQ